MPSSSATCSTTTVSTIASRSARVSQRCSIGRRNSTSRVGVAAGAAHQRGQRDGVGAPVVGDLRGVLDGVLHQPEPVLPALVDVGDDAEHQVVEALARGPQLRLPGVAREHRRATHPASAAVAHPPARRRTALRRCAVLHAASLIGRGRCGGYRLPRESCPSLFAYRLRPRRGRAR